MNKILLFTLLLANFYLANASTRMAAYRWRNDNGNETTATWKAALNEPLKIYNLDVIRLRIAVENSPGSGQPNTTFYPDIQFSTDGSNWRPLNDPDSPFSYVGSSNVADGVVTTQQIATNNSSSFMSGLFVSASGHPTMTSPSNNNSFTEYEFSIKPNLLISDAVYYSFKGADTWGGPSAMLTYCSTQEPSASSTQNLSANAKVQDLIAVGDNLKWYEEASGGVVLDQTAVLATGSYYVTQTVSCESARKEVQVNIGSLGLDDNNLDLSTSLKVYPNPSNDIFFIKSEFNGTVVLFDLLGKEIQSQKMDSGTTTLDLGNAPKGVYLLKVTNENNQSKTVKLVRN